MSIDYDTRDFCAICGEPWDACGERAGDSCRDCLEAYEDQIDQEQAPRNWGLDDRYEVSLAEVANELGISTQMVHIIEQRALAKLRAVLRAKKWGREEEMVRG